MAITILIVDDDKLLVDKLEETVNWSKIGIDMVFTANNIRQAQKLLEEYPIEMLLCDIDMPQGNGLELLEWIRYKKLDIECAFLSSYANFAYAQMALKLSSREYLLKPISNRASSFGRDCKGKTAEDKSTGKYRTERKETMGRSSDPVYAGRILDRAGKKEI